jgi:hypothetical protein
MLTNGLTSGPFVPISEGLAFPIVMVGHSRPKDGVASLAYVPAIHALLGRKERRGCPGQ